MQTRRKYDKLKLGAIITGTIGIITLLSYVITVSSTATEVKLQSMAAYQWVSKNQSLPTRVETVEKKCELYDKTHDASIRVEGKIDTILNELLNLNRRMEKVERKIDNGNSH